MSSARVDPALVLRRRALRRTEGRRRLGVLCAAVGMVLLPLGYWGLEHSSVFSISRVAVTGATPRVDGLVRQAVAADVQGRSLLEVDSGALARRIEAIPDVRLASVDRAFPHTVSISVVMERPAAFVRSGKVRYVVSADGRVLRTITKTSPRRLPRFNLAAAPAPVPGQTVRTAQIRAALHVLQAVPPGFARTVARLRGVVANSAGVVAVFGHGLQVRLGTDGSLGLKLRVAERLLSRMGGPIRRSVAYVDASAPARPAIGYHK